jgi:hypothetical protein
LRPDVALDNIDCVESAGTNGSRSCVVAESGASVTCRPDPLEGCLPNASGQEVSLETVLWLDRPELPSFQGLAGQFFSGVEGTIEVSLLPDRASVTWGATRVDECSCVLVGKKSVVSMLDRLGF